MEFFSTPGGIAVLIIFIVVVVFLILDLNYKFFAKVALDWLAAFLVSLVFFIGHIVLAIVAYKREGHVFEKKLYLGHKGKVIELREYAGIDSRIRYVARLFDVMAGRLAIVGVEPLKVEDGALLDDEQMDRFDALPGMFSYLSVWGKEDLTYEEMFELDKKYAKRRELFFEIWAMILHLAKLSRGGRSTYLGETGGDGYLACLIEKGQISEKDAATAREYATEAVAQNEKRKSFDQDRNTLSGS